MRWRMNTIEKKDLHKGEQAVLTTLDPWMSKQSNRAINTTTDIIKKGNSSRRSINMDSLLLSVISILVILDY